MLDAKNRPKEYQWERQFQGTNPCDLRHFPKATHMKEKPGHKRAQVVDHIVYTLLSKRDNVCERHNIAGTRIKTKTLNCVRDRNAEREGGPVTKEKE